MGFELLRREIRGDVLIDMPSRRLYATDASIYQDIPAAVVLPRGLDDCVAIVKFAWEHGIPIIPRAAGTSLAGQCVGNGMVVDCSCHMKDVIAIDDEAGRATVQPGVILDDLNDCLRPHGLMFAPDTSTSNRCMIGGMIGNNAAGAFSLRYGTTREHVIEVEAVLSDGSLAVFAPLSNDELERKCRQKDMEGSIYRTMFSLIEEHRGLILSRFPESGIIRRNTGYALDYLAESRPWNPHGPDFNLAPFLCGSEGTLAMVTKAVLNLVPVTKASLLVCIHFASLDEAMRAVVPILGFQPAAVELMDRRILELAAGNLEQARNRFWIDGAPDAILVTEFVGQGDAEVQSMAERLVGELQHQGLGYAYPLIGGADKARVWEVRKAGLGLLMGLNSDRKPVTVIEDAAVLPRDLADFVRDLQAMMRRYRADCVYYGHASVGLLHFRPELDLADAADRNRFNGIAGDFASLVRRYHGSLSGEHGDGRLRGPFLRQMLGDEVYGLLRQVKQAFDPHGIFNPGKIIADLPIDQGLRPRPERPVAVQTGFDWSADHGVFAAVERCNGAAACRKAAGKGTMCPSYQATGDELFSTRGRANLIRQALLEDDPVKGLGDPGLQRSLELCLGCKGCKSECPSSVDLARLKAEALYLHHQTSSRSARDRLLRGYPAMLRLASGFPRISHALMRSNLLRRVTGLKRRLPAVARESMRAAMQAHVRQRDGGSFERKVILLCDIHTQYLEPQVGLAAVRVLESLGFEVVPLYAEHSPGLLISLGFLEEARECLRKILHDAVRLMEGGSEACVGLEPAELLTLRDEAPDIVGSDMRAQAVRLAAHAELFEGFVLKQARLRGMRTAKPSGGGTKVALHVHCHEKALLGPEQSLEMLRTLVDADARHLATGCCGMAGHFGYSHPEMSHRIAAQSLLPELARVPQDAIIISSGSSCRAQIREYTGRRVLHPAEVLDMKLEAAGDL